MVSVASPLLHLANYLGLLYHIIQSKGNNRIIYFAGHGLSNNFSTYLVPIDTDDIDVGIDLDQLRRIIISKSRPGLSILILLDCCHSGAAQIRDYYKSTLRYANNADIDRHMHSLGSGCVVMAACQSHELAHEEPSLNHGVFTFYLLEGMYGDAADHLGNITLPNLYDYVSKRFKKYVKQIPVFKGDIIGQIILGTNLSPRERTEIPEYEADQLQELAVNLINEYIQSTSVDIASWDRDIYRYACSSLLPKLQWFERHLTKYPQLSKFPKFNSAYSTAQSKLAELGHLKEGLSTELGIVEKKLGAGTFGTVWKIGIHNDSSLAYKVYHPIDLGNTEKMARFSRGYRAMAQLDHPHIVKVQKFTECPIGFIMDFINGPNLRDFAHFDLNSKEILLQLLTVGETLKHAHSRGVIHRDVKPENIIMSFEQEGTELNYRPKLTDFDLAWFSTATVFTKEGVGSLIYAAPEQLSKPQSSVAHDNTTDIYAFGQLSFFFICRRDPVPLLSNNKRALGEALLSWGVADAAKMMLEIYERCTQQNPSDRYNDFREICDQLYEIMQLISETDHQKPIGPDEFIRELIFAIIGLTPECKLSESSFYTKTGLYMISISYNESSKSKYNISIDISAQSPPVVDGITVHKQVRNALNKRVDDSIRGYSIATRKSGTHGYYNTIINIKNILLNIDGVETCREILMRIINGLEGG